MSQRPVLHSNISDIEIETKDICIGSFTIKNTGSDILKGQIISRCTGLIFDPIEWEGNSQTITYTFNAQDAGLSPGDVAHGHAYISSNGGEIRLAVTARLTKMSISTPEGIAIANLQDFFEYAQTNPTQARRIFVDSEFYMLLLALEYEYMEAYESLHKDSNRERALDNFFILSGLKGKTNITIPVKKFDFTYPPNSRKPISSTIQLEKTDGGYVEAAISQGMDAIWLNCNASRVTASDFKDGLQAAVDFSIDIGKISAPYVREFVHIGGDTVEITCRCLPSVTFALNRTAFRFDDRGTIAVTNNTGHDIRVEVYCPESYVRFKARSYIIGQSGEIPFDIRPSAFLSAQLFFRKTLYMKTVIELRAAMPGLVFSNKLPLFVGEW